MQPGPRNAFDRLLLRIVDGGLAGVIFVVPLVMGGRHPLGQLLLVGLSVAMAVAWAAHLCCLREAAWRPTWAVPLLLAGAMLVTLQAIPLPPAVLHWLAPHNADLLPLWHSTGASGVGLGDWRYISLNPAETRGALAIFLAYGLLFLVISQRLEDVGDVERLLRWCAASAIGMATFGLVQLVTSNGAYFWFYEYYQCLTDKVAVGSFTNRNHFAQFLALGIGPLIWWIQNAVGQHRSSGHSRHGRGRSSRDSAAHNENPQVGYCLWLSLGIVLLAGLLSLSRGGAIAITAATVIGISVCFFLSSLNRKILVALAGAMALTGISLAIFGYDFVSERLETISSGSLEKLDAGSGRRDIWAATLQSIPHHLPLGSGVGSFVDVHPAHTDMSRHVTEFSHGENSYLPVALETGVAGVALLLGGIVLCGWWCFRGILPGVPTRLRLCAGMVAASLFASTVHAVVDFIWYVPACAAMVTVLMAIALRVHQLADGVHSERLPRFTPAAMGAGVAVLGGWMLTTMFGPAMAGESWNRCRLLLQDIEPSSAASVQNTASTKKRGPSGGIEAEQRLIAELENVLAWQPSHPRAHLQLADAYLRVFERVQATSDNPMSLVNVRDAVRQSQFSSQEALRDWLSRAIGDNWLRLEKAMQHAREAIALSPLQGRAYAYLAELSFLDTGPHPSVDDYMTQAVRVRPFDGVVLCRVGSEAYLVGDSKKWLDCYKRAFRCGREQQQRLIAEMIGNTADENIPAMIDFIIREFQPEWKGLQFLHQVCVKRCPKEQLLPLIRYRASWAAYEAGRVRPSEASIIWIEAMDLHASLEENEEAVQCGRNALQCEPNNPYLHQRFGARLLQQQRFAEAETQLRWCQRRMPNDQGIASQLRQAVKGRIEAERRAAAGESPIVR